MASFFVDARQWLGQVAAIQPDWFFFGTYLAS